MPDVEPYAVFNKFNNDNQYDSLFGVLACPDRNNIHKLQFSVMRTLRACLIIVYLKKMPFQGELKYLNRLYV